MKIKQFSKKLLLNKKTIANLNYGEMSYAFGGAATQIAIPKPGSPPPPDPTSCVCTALYTNCATETTSVPPAECCICNN